MCALLYTHTQALGHFLNVTSHLCFSISLISTCVVSSATLTVEWSGCLSLYAGWLLLEVRGNWIKQRRYWFVLSQDSLDYYSGSEKGARRLGTLVLTSLCSVIWPDKQKYKETGEGRTLMHTMTHKPFLTCT